MSLRTDFLDGLIDHVERDHYPSEAQLAAIEAGAGREQLERYVQVLLGKIRQDTYPSVEMVRRVQRLVARLPE